MKPKASFSFSSTAGGGQSPGLGALLLAVGAFICAIALGWIPSPPESFNAPREIVLAAGLLFALAGLLFAINGRAPAWVMGFVGACIWTAFALIPSWIAWGAGPRNFSGDGLWLLALVGLDFQTLGRTVFGLSALILWVGALAAWFAWLKSLPRIGQAPAVLALLAFTIWMAWGRYLEPAAVTGSSDADRLAQYIAARHLNIDASSDNEFLEPREELWIKRARARIAAGRTPPLGSAVIDVPEAGAAPDIDGVIGEAEWRAARALAAPAPGRGGRVLVMRSRDKLYVAGEAFADRSSAGFDQMRVYFHIDLAQAFANERVFVSGSGGATSLRSVRLPGSQYEKTEWTILHGIQGASAVTRHRQFELSLDMAEAGLPAGGAFPVFVEIEGDPLRTSAGKFKARRIEGRVGSYQTPIWLRLPE
ncbi:MAG: hypothetical protein JNL06_02135 [Alphaproteobacteria bacterium]|nr:hypothetical protein [Alphaproteobacteria bacterium]